MFDNAWLPEGPAPAPDAYTPKIVPHNVLTPSGRYLATTDDPEVVSQWRKAGYTVERV